MNDTDRLPKPAGPAPDGAKSADESASPRREDPHDQLRRLELTAILGCMNREDREFAERSIWGLALSGGGIRSATFALGVLQALAECKWLGGFHYVSTVSGGGYIGAYLQGLLHRRKLDEVMEELAHHRSDNKEDVTLVRGHAEPAQPGDTIRQLRCFSNYLAPNKAGLSTDRVSVASTYLSNMLLTQVQLGAALLLATFVPLFLYIAVAHLATAPWLTWTLALLLTLLAMAMRGLAQDLALAHSMGGERYQMPWLLAASPPLLLALTMALLATLLWGVGDCSIAPDGDCKRWTRLAEFGKDACSIRGLPGKMCSVGKAGGFQALGVASVYLAGFLAWLIWWAKRESHSPKFSERLIRQLVVGVLSTVGMAWLIYGVLTAVDTRWLAEVSPPQLLVGDPLEGRALGPHFWGVLILGTPTVFLAFFVVSLIQIGLTFFTDQDRVTRERWARLMGRCAVWVVFGICLPAALIALGPWLVRQIAAMGGMQISNRGAWDWFVPLLSIAASALGARAAYFDQTSQGASSNPWVNRLRRLVIAIAPWAFVLGILLLAAVATEWLLTDPLGRDQVRGYTFTPVWQPLVWLHQAIYSPPWERLLLTLLIIAGVGLVFAKYIDENEFSMNGFYRNRLVRCYLGPTNNRRRGDPDTDLDPVGDDIKLAALIPGKRTPAANDGRSGGHRPLYPLISAAVNLTSTQELDWQDRKAASFVFSPLFCGHHRLVRPGSRHVGDIPPGDIWHDDLTPEGLKASTLAVRTTLGTAVSISGAAVSPNMGYHSSPAVAFLLTLFNARLGWWMENLHVQGGLLGFVGSKLLAELLSRSGDRSRYSYVSDGGHFENLGIYELVRRRCRFIMSVDATADPDRDFESLGNAIHKCRVDLGASIDIDVTLMRPGEDGVSRRCATLGKICYADGTKGFLLYLKPSLLGNESADIVHYASAHKEFPHEPTSDQFFDEHQFEAYRELGQASGRRVLMKTLERLDVSVRASSSRQEVCGLNLENNESKENLLLELEHMLFEPSNAMSIRFTRHGASLSRLFESQRNTAALQCLDDQINPGWLHAGGAPCHRPDGAPPHLALPEPKDFRECFYFVQQLVQLMESVYLDLDLERNWQHPDNRGWINLFRQWAWVPMFRLAWALTSQTYGSRFVRFCETQLDAPKISCVLQIEWQMQACRGTSLEDLVKRLPVTFIEREILNSDAVKKRCDESSCWDVGLLSIDWTKIFGKPPPGSLKSVNVGIVVAVSEPEPGVQGDAPLTRLIVARVQDHVRRVGIGAEMVYQAIGGSYKSIRLADVRSGDYGPTVGKLSEEVADRQNRELREMLLRARRRRGWSARPDASR